METATVITILGVALTISEILASTDRFKSSSNIQLVANVLRVLLKK